MLKNNTKIRRTRMKVGSEALNCNQSYLPQGACRACGQDRGTSQKMFDHMDSSFRMRK